MIDEEVRTLVDGAYKRTLSLVRDRTDLINSLASRLLEKETIVQEDIVEILGERPFESSRSYKDFVQTAFGEDADKMDARAAGPSDDDGDESGHGGEEADTSAEEGSGSESDDSE